MENEIQLALRILHWSNDEPGDASTQNLRGMNQWRTLLLNNRFSPGCPCIANFLRTLEHHGCFLSQDTVAADSGPRFSHGWGPSVGFRPVSFINVPVRISSLICVFYVESSGFPSF